ncbi:MAG: DUF177 domain-containing protein [Flavobacteriales bacterium]|nr:DUF177 domain-containing protein [Flavobacteriales bacterium]
MKDLLKQFDIPISSLKSGLHTYSYSIGQDLIDYFEYEDNWDDAQISAVARLEKRTNLMELNITVNGSVHTWCDVTGEEFRLPIEGSEDLIIKIQDIPSDDDQVIVLSPLETTLNIGQYIYETIVLAVPTKRYHPDYVAGKMDAPIPYSEDKDSVSVYHSSTHNTKDKDDDEGEIDPRWAKLKDILN